MSSKIVLTLCVAFASQLFVLSLSLNTGRSGLQWKFSVKLDNPLKSFEKLGISGDADFLGNWSPNAVVFLDQTNFPTLWTGSVQCEENTSVNYRFFVGVEAENGDLQVRQWETHVEGRTIDIGTEAVETLDYFGIVNGEKKIHRGWLNSGYLLQLKLFRNPIKLNDVDGNHQKIFVKIDALDLNNQSTPIPSSARAYVEVIRMRYEDSKINAQPKFGVPYEKNDILMFHITTNDIYGIVYKLKVYKVDGEGKKIVTGYAHIHPEILKGSEGIKDLDIISPDDESVIGTLNLGYIWIKPLPKRDPILDFRTTFAHYWPEEWKVLTAGHRGLGNSLEVEERAAPVIENTVASMKAAADHGADIVEFDVHCTSDHVPFIFHNFQIPVAKNSSVRPTSSADITTRLVKNMTYEELKNTRIYEVVGSEVIEYKSHNEEPCQDWRLFPTLEDLLVRVPLSVGMDIEIKWPQLQSDGDPESPQTIDKNLFVDTVLDVMFRTGCGRMSFFSSEDADILTMMRYKQNMFGGMTLGYSEEGYYADPRTEKYVDILNNAVALELMGIAPNSFNFNENGSENIKMAKAQGLKVCIWGDEISNSSSTLQYYRDFDPECVIIDRLDIFLPKEKKSFFSKGKFPEYFQKQCSIRNS